MTQITAPTPTTLAIERRAPRLVIVGLSIASSWGNGHATVYRCLTKGLAAHGCRVDFLERRVPWYDGEHRDCPDPPGADLHFYDEPAELDDPGGPLRPLIESADAVILGSYVPDGPDIARRLFELAGQDMVSFYDIDTPVTLAALRRGDCEYLDPADIPRFAAYFSFAGGRSLQRLGNDFAARRPLPLYCCVDPDLYHPDPDVPRDLDLGYMGTYSDDRQPTVQRLLLEPANQLPGQRFALVGPQYPQDLTLPSNVQRTPHLPPAEHRGFYNRQRFTLNVTRADMIEAGHSPSVRLFEAAACGTPLISDRWDGIEECFEPDREILLADDADDVVGYLRRVSEDDRQQLAERARRRILQHHTARVRSAQLLRALHLPCAADQPGPAQ